MKRKIIQVSVSPAGSGHCNTLTTVLCDDGTLWKLTDHINANWERIRDLPQDNLYRNDIEPSITKEWHGQEKYEGRDIGDLK